MVAQLAGSVESGAGGNSLVVPRDARVVTQWLIVAGISLNTVSLFLRPHGWTAVVKVVLQVGTVVCFVVAFTRLWRARRRRLQSLADDDLSPGGPSR